MEGFVMKFLNLKKMFLAISLLLSFDVLYASHDFSGIDAGLEEAQKAQEAQDQAKKELADKQKEQEDLKQQKDAQEQQEEDRVKQEEDKINKDPNKNDEQKKEALDELEKQKQDTLSKIAENYTAQYDALANEIVNLTQKVTDAQTLVETAQKNLEAKKAAIQQNVTVEFNSMQKDMDIWINSGVSGTITPVTVHVQQYKNSLDEYNGAETILNPEQQVQQKVLLIKADFLFNKGHSSLIELCNDSVLKTLSKYKEGKLFIDKAIEKIKNSISRYTRLPDTETIDKSPFQNEKQELLDIINKFDSNSSKKDKEKIITEIQEKLQNITDNIQKEYIRIQDDIGKITVDFNQKNAIQQQITETTNRLQSNSDEIDVNLGFLINGQTKIYTSVLLKEIDSALENNKYDKTGNGSEVEASIFLNYDLYRLNEFYNRNKNSLSKLNEENNKLIEQATGKIDTTIFYNDIENQIKIFENEQKEIENRINKLVDKRIGIKITNSQLEQSIKDYNSSPQEANEVVKSTISNIGSKIIDVFSTLFFKFKNLVFNKTVIEFKDQTTEIQKGIQAMQQDVETFQQQKAQPLIDRVNNNYDIKKPLQDAKKLDAQYKEAQSLLEELQKVQVQVQIRKNGFDQVFKYANAVDVLSSIDSELQGISAFRNSAESFDKQLMKDYFKPLNSLSDDVLIQLGKDCYTRKGSSNFDEIGNNKLKLAGQKLFNTIANKDFLSMNYNEVMVFVRVYEIKNTLDSGGKDFKNMLLRGGDFAWQQVKTVLNGGLSYQKTISQESIDNFKTSVIKKLNPIKLDINASSKEVAVAIDNLNLWIGLVDKVRVDKSYSLEIQQIGIDTYNTNLQSNKNNSSVGLTDNLYIGSNAIMPLPELTN